MTAEIRDLFNSPKYQWHGVNPFQEDEGPDGCECGAYSFHVISHPNYPQGVRRLQCTNCQSIKETLVVVPNHHREQPSETPPEPEAA